MLRVSLFWIILFGANSLFSAFGQTLIINEVSQGETGNQEYVEFVVVDTAVTYNCLNTQPPCIDIRGWIFDDNSGYHGTTGIATGAIRFSFDPIWSCVALGTIIVIYNDADPNPLMPAIDISTTDGNCRIVAPISNTSLFESNSTTPGAVACSYPASGWTPGGDWSTTLLANGGDCARIVNLAGCEVFSVCWGTNNLNNIIYFAGGATSANSATNTVYYFNGGNPALQANWSIGCADVPACGIEDQTPGAPNNPANAAFIGQFNNNCSPITPLVASATVISDAACACTGQASASGSGSIPGYSYAWYNASFSPIGQTTATATNLCGGTYNVIVTSSIGCQDTAQVTINATGTASVSVNSGTVCAGDPITLSATPSANGGSYLWSPGGQTTASITVSPTTTTNYTVMYQIGTCADSATANVTVNPIPSVSAGPNSTICEGNSITLSGQGASSYVWTNGVQNNVSFIPAVGTTNYTVVGTDINGCSASASVTVTVMSGPLANALIAPSSGIAPLTVDFTNLSTGGTSYFWDFGNGNDTTTSTTTGVMQTYSAGSYQVILLASNGFCQSTWTDQVFVSYPLDPVLIEIPNVFTPNGDFSNDVFFIHSENLKSLSGSIVNRWGNTLLEFDSIDFTWDGEVNGQKVNEGTYFVIYKGVGFDQQIYEGQSFLQLVR